MKSKFPLFVALVIGVAALLSIQSYVNKEKLKAQAQLRGDPVVAASTDIPEGAELTMSLISAKEVPRQFIPQQAIRGSAEVKQIMGRKTRVKISKDQIILWSDLASEARGGFSSVIPPGMGAFTVPIARGIKQGLIQPSDHIDIIGSFAAPKSTQPGPPTTAASWRQSSDMVNVVLLQNVLVLAVGDSYGSAGRVEAGGGELTLALDLAEAQLMMFAGEHGELGAMLRREGAVGVKPRGETSRLTFEAIEKIIGELEEKRNVRMIEIQSGASKTVVPVSNPEPEKGGKP